MVCELLQDSKILDMSELKASADNKLKVSLKCWFLTETVGEKRKMRIFCWLPHLSPIPIIFLSLFFVLKLVVN